MQSDDADIAVPVLVVLALIVGIGVYHNLTREPPRLTEAEIVELLHAPVYEEKTGR